MAWENPGLEWRLTTPVKIVSDHNILLVRCLSTSSCALQVRELYARTSNAALFNLNRVGAATGLGASGIVITPIWGVIGGASGAAWTSYGKAYYGTTTVASGIRGSGATSVTWRMVPAGSGGEIIDSVMVQPGQALILRADPDAAGYVQATCKVRVVPLGEYRP